VLQEAHEKAFERLVMGLKEYEKEKAKILAERKEVLHQEFEKKQKDNAAQRRINKSTKINESRMKKMNSRQT
jgi:V-type H+-transporting ATPase subunit E